MVTNDLASNYIKLYTCAPDVWRKLPYDAYCYTYIMAVNKLPDLLCNKAGSLAPGSDRGRLDKSPPSLNSSISFCLATICYIYRPPLSVSVHRDNAVMIKYETPVFLGVSNMKRPKI